ncbi:MAG: hypothetical protein V3V01_07150, partial [Acidimicrobiales bacterium]
RLWYRDALRVAKSGGGGAPSAWAIGDRIRSHHSPGRKLGLSVGPDGSIEICDNATARVLLELSGWHITIVASVFANAEVLPVDGEVWIPLRSSDQIPFEVGSRFRIQGSPPVVFRGPVATIVQGSGDSAFQHGLPTALLEKSVWDETDLEANAIPVASAASTTSGGFQAMPLARPSRRSGQVCSRGLRAWSIRR